ncbi:hypothetical protein ACFQRB_16675 [Halobaculum litoreum]|uniref:Uncharacterized protein n=1 Tax=Halobaculum litoreum TaxID=3031998 RepID=A0ABD5XWS2_9EURY
MTDNVLPDNDKNYRLVNAVTTCLGKARDHFFEERSKPAEFLFLLPHVDTPSITLTPDERKSISDQVKSDTYSVFQESDCLECTDGEFREPASVFALDRGFQDLFCDADYELLFDESRHKLADDYPESVSSRVRNIPDLHNVGIVELLTACQERDFFSEQSMEWVVDFCATAIAYREAQSGTTNEFDTALAALPVLWLSDSNLLSPNEVAEDTVYFPLTESWALPGTEDVLSELNVLNRTFCEHMNTVGEDREINPRKLFTTVFNVKELRPKTLIKRLLPNLKKRHSSSKSRHRREVRFLYEYYRRNNGLAIQKEDLGKICLQTQTGKYKPANYLLLTDKYREDHTYRLDPIADALSGVDQVSHTYAQLTSDEDASSWGHSSAN